MTEELTPAESMRRTVEDLAGVVRMFERAAEIHDQDRMSAAALWRVGNQRLAVHVQAYTKARLVAAALGAPHAGFDTIVAALGTVAERMRRGVDAAERAMREFRVGEINAGIQALGEFHQAIDGIGAALATSIESARSS